MCSYTVTAAMDQQGDPELSPKTPPPRPRIPMQISSPHSIAHSTKISLRSSNSAKFIKSTRSTRFLEKRKRNEYSKAKVYEGNWKSPIENALFQKGESTSSIEPSIILPSLKALESATENIAGPSSNGESEKATIIHLLDRSIKLHREDFVQSVKHGSYSRSSMVELVKKTLSSGYSLIPETASSQRMIGISDTTNYMSTVRPSMQDLFHRSFEGGENIPTDQQETDCNIPTHTISKHISCALSRPYQVKVCSHIDFTDTVTNVCKLFSSFSGEKAKLLRFIGFDGLCTFPYEGSTSDLSFYIWLLTKVDCSRSIIHLGDTRTIPIKDTDINLITGLPCAGHSVITNERSPLIKRSNAAVVKRFLSVGNIEAEFTVPYVHYVVNKQYDTPMSEAEKYGFCIAAVVYAVSSFLAVEAGQVRFPFELTNSLIDPTELKSHNWCQLVRRSLVKQAASVQKQIRDGLKTIKVGGCPFIAQVLYLDNVQFGMNLVPDYIYPRGCLYSQQLVHTLIQKDSKINPISSIPLYGNHEFKKDYLVSYSRMNEYAMNALEQHKRKRDEYDEEYLEMKREGHARNLAVSKEGRHLSVGQLVLQAHQRIHSKSPNKDRAIYKSYTSRYATIPFDRLDLSLKLPEISGNIEEPNYQDVLQTDSNRARALHDNIYEDPLIKCMKFYRRLDRLEKFDLSCVNWYCHNTPYNITISGETLRRQATRGTKYGKEYLDGLTRMLTSLNDKKYEGSRLREKHYMAYSWSCDMLEARKTGFIQHSNIFFVGEFFKYDVQKCNQFVALVKVGQSISCYIWDFLDETITVLDPVLMNSPTIHIKAEHEGSVQFLKKCMFDAISLFYPHWTLQRDQWTIIYKNDVSKRCNFINSGLYALLYAQFYTANKLIIPVHKVDKGLYRARHLWELLNMAGNSGDVPVPINLAGKKGLLAVPM